MEEPFKVGLELFLAGQEPHNIESVPVLVSLPICLAEVQFRDSQSRIFFDLPLHGRSCRAVLDGRTFQSRFRPFENSSWFGRFNQGDSSDISEKVQGRTCSWKASGY
jgi:hypothetical protein